MRDSGFCRSWEAPWHRTVRMQTGGWSRMVLPASILASDSSDALTLRADGIAAVLSGAGQGGPAQVTIRSSASPAPYVVVMRVSATLPAR